MGAEYALAIGGLIGAAARSWVTNSQDFLSRRTILDVAIGGAIGLLYPLYPVIELPTASLMQQGTLLAVIAYFGNDLVINVLSKIGVKLPDTERRG